MLYKSDNFTFDKNLFLKKGLNIDLLLSRQWLILFVILIVTFFAYSSVLNHEFIRWDDDKQITDNSYVKTIDKQNIIHNLYQERYTFIPLTIYSVIYYFKGLNPSPFHLLNIIIHLLNILFACILARKLIQNISAALFVAVLFALHPMRIESVAWISELKDLLFTFFSLQAFLVYVKYLNNEKKIRYLIIVFLLAFLASFSKIQGLLIAPTLILFDVYYERKLSVSVILEKIMLFIFVLFVFKFISWYSLFLAPLLVVVVYYRKRIKERIPVKTITLMIIALSLLICLFVIYYFSCHSSGLWTTTPDKRNVFSFIERIFLAGYALLFYITHFFFPLNLNAVHPYPQRLGDGSLPAEYYFSSIILLFIVVVSVCFIVKRKKISKLLFFGWFFFLVNISMVLHFIPIEGRLVVADRYSYLAYFGLFVIIADLIRRYIIQNQKTKGLYVVLFTGILFLLSVLTYSRSKVWHSTQTLFEDVLKKNQNIPFAYLNMGGIYLNKHLPTNALLYFNKSIKQDSLDPSAYFNRALAYFMSGKSDSALADFSKVIKLSSSESDKALVYTNMGEIYHKAGKDSLALVFYLKSLETDSSIAASYNNLGMYYFQKRDLNKAYKDFEKAVNLDPDYADAWNNKGWVLTMQGNIKDAMKCFDHSLLINPGYAMAYNNRGYLKFKTNDIQGSLSDYNQALKLDSSLTEAYLNRGWIYSSAGNFRLAVTDYSRVLNRIRSHQTALTNRAFAWFYMKEFQKASADFDDAVKYYPNMAVSHQNLAWFKMQMKEYDIAINEFNRALELDSTLANSFLNLGWIWMEKGNTLKAGFYFNKVLELSPQNGEAFFLLGELNRKKSEMNNACKYYAEAVKYGNKQAKNALEKYCK